MGQNTICHVEWDVTDLERAQEFYAAVFDWTFRPFGPEMIAFGSGDQHLGGLMKTDKVEPGSSPSVWIQVDEIESQLAKVASAGGKVLKEKSEVPSVGWSAQFSDLDGNAVGIVQFSE